MKPILAHIAGISLMTLASTSGAPALSFALSFDSAGSSKPLDGRLLLLLSTDPKEEPRFQINDSPKSQIVFGLDVNDWKPGELLKVTGNDPDLFGYPIRSFGDLKPGEYAI